MLAGGDAGFTDGVGGAAGRASGGGGVVGGEVGDGGESVVGDKDLYTAEDCLASGVDILGGCQGCHATIAAYNAYPSTSGYWRCADCIGTSGYATVADFTASMPGTTCPGCGNTDNIGETRITTERAEEYALECGDCGQVWPS